MKTKPCILGQTGGYTLVELIITVTILSILMAIVSASWETLQARIRYSAAKANMDAIANAGYTDFANNGDWDVMSLLGMPPRIAANRLLSKWPDPPCPGWFYTWDNWDGTAGFLSIRVSLRKANQTAVLSYCVNSYANGTCADQDPLSSAAPIEISGKVLDPHIYCSN